MQAAFSVLSDIKHIFLPQRFAAIKDLNIAVDLTNPLWRKYYEQEWERADDQLLPVSDNGWGIINNMKGLRKLRLNIDCELIQDKSQVGSELESRHATEEDLLRPLMKLNWIQDFEVQVSWPANEESDRVLRDAPFKLKRISDGE